MKRSGAQSLFLVCGNAVWCLKYVSGLTISCTPEKATNIVKWSLFFGLRGIKKQCTLRYLELHT